MDKGNMFKDQARRRVKEQAEIEAIVTGDTAARDEKPKQEKRATMCIAMSESEKRMLKQYALSQGRTTSSIVQEWIREFCRNQ